jgi:DNA-binding MarR family transcriptional regulator
VADQLGEAPVVLDELAGDLEDLGGVALRGDEGQLAAERAAEVDGVGLLLYRDHDHLGAPLGGVDGGVEDGGDACGVDVDVGAGAGLAERVGRLAVQLGQPGGDVLGSGVDDGVSADRQCGLEALGDDVCDDDVLDPRSLSQIVAPRPMGPAPKTMTLSPGLASDRLTQCRATAMGSLRAATAKGTVSGNTAPGVLAIQMSVEASHITRQLRQLEQAGYVTRVPDPDDGRAQRVEITDAGRAAYERVREASRRGIEMALADWSPEDLRQLAVLFDRLVDDFVARAEYPVDALPSG